MSVSALLVVAQIGGCAEEPVVLTVEAVRDRGFEGYRASGEDGELVLGRTLHIALAIDNRTEATISGHRSLVFVQPAENRSSARTHYSTELVDDSCAPRASRGEYVLPPRSTTRCTMVFVVPDPFTPSVVTLWSYTADVVVHGAVPTPIASPSDAGDG